MSLSIPLQVPLNVEAEDPEEWRREEQEKIDTAEPLNEEEQQEKERLLNEVRVQAGRNQLCLFMCTCSNDGVPQ